MNPNIFFSNFSGASRQNPGISRHKSLIPWVSRDIPNFLAPAPSRGRPPPHQKISGLKSLGLGSFFVPELCSKPFSPFFALFRRVRRAPGKSRKRRKKAFFLRYPRICLNPHLLNPHLRHSNICLNDFMTDNSMLFSPPSGCRSISALLTKSN